MSENSDIQWTDHTLNIWSGCVEEHTGCPNCYAKALPPSMRRGAKWGHVWAGGTRVMASEEYMRQPYRWARAAAKEGRRARVFVCSTSDVLEVPGDPPPQVSSLEIMKRVAEVRAQMDAARERFWPIAEETAYVCGGCGRPCAHSSDTPHRTSRLLELQSVGAACEGVTGRCLNAKMGGLDFLLLTKRPQNWHLVPPWARALAWLGTSVSNQETANEWVPRLLAAEGFRYRFLSIEPLVGPVDLSGFFGGPYAGLPGDVVHENYNFGISWVICGGESGRKARPCNVGWLQAIMRQCRAAGVAAFCKQLGSNPVYDGNFTPSIPVETKDTKGGDMAEWPEDLRVRQFPGGSEVRP